MANQFQDMFEGTDQKAKIEIQGKFGTWVINLPGRDDLWWGGFKSILSARRYAILTLGIQRKNIEEVLP